QVGVTNQDADARTYALTGAPSGMTISTSGQLSWATAVAGTCALTLTVTDAGGARAIQTWTLNVVAPLPPQFGSSPPTASVTAGLPYRYDVQATDPYSSALTYALRGAPS